MCWPRQQT
jgi:acyl carrier protein